jgi:hypothetical protein
LCCKPLDIKALKKKACGLRRRMDLSRTAALPSGLKKRFKHFAACLSLGGIENRTEIFVADLEFW